MRFDADEAESHEDDANTVPKMNQPGAEASEQAIKNITEEDRKEHWRLLKRQRSEEQFRCGTGHAGRESGRNHSGRHRARASASQHAQKGTAVPAKAQTYKATNTRRPSENEPKGRKTQEQRQTNQETQKRANNGSGKRSKRTKSKDIPSTNSKEK